MLKLKLSWLIKENCQFLALFADFDNIYFWIGFGLKYLDL